MAYNFDQICRLCMRTEAILQDIFSGTENLRTRIEELSPKLQITVGDGLPTQVCQECVQQVEAYSNFRLQCEKSDVTLRQQLTSNKNKQDSAPEILTECVANSRKESLNLSENVVPIVSEVVKQEPSVDADNVHCMEQPEAGVNDSNEEETMDEDNLPEILTECVSISRKESLNIRENAVPIVSEVVKQEPSVDDDDVRCMEHPAAGVNGSSEEETMEEDGLPEIITEHVANSRKESLNISENAVPIVSQVVKQEPSVDADNVHCMEQPEAGVNDSNEEETMDEVVNDFERELLGTIPETASFASQEFKQELDPGSENEFKEQSFREDSEDVKKEVIKSLVNIMHKCQTCSEVFLSQEAQNQHKCSAPYRCQICMKVKTSVKDLCKHMSRHKNEPCRICGKSFTDKSFYLAHVRTHSGIGCKCEYCGKVYASATLCKIHRRKHTGEKPFICEFCGKAFAMYAHYYSHVPIHTGKKPFKCPHCPKSFAIKTYLQYHIRTHTGERPHICEICGKCFGDPGKLGCHIKNTHAGPNQRDYKCNVCLKQYTLKSTLRKHMKTHTGECPYECHLCGKKFVLRECLTRHIAIHEGQTYDCTWCNKSFSTLSAKIRHVRTHTGEKPFGCATCDKAFSLRRDLVKHVFKFQH